MEIDGHWILIVFMAGMAVMGLAMLEFIDLPTSIPGQRTAFIAETFNFSEDECVMTSHGLMSDKVTSFRSCIETFDNTNIDEVCSYLTRQWCSQYCHQVADRNETYGCQSGEAVRRARELIP